MTVGATPAFDRRRRPGRLGARQDEPRGRHRPKRPMSAPSTAMHAAPPVSTAALRSPNPHISPLSPSRCSLRFPLDRAWCRTATGHSIARGKRPPAAALSGLIRLRSPDSRGFAPGIAGTHHVNREPLHCSSQQALTLTAAGSASAPPATTPATCNALVGQGRREARDAHRGVPAPAPVRSPHGHVTLALTLPCQGARRGSPSPASALSGQRQGRRPPWARCRPRRDGLRCRRPTG